MQLALIIDYISDFMWPFARVSGLLLVAPILGSAYIPSTIKILIAVAITIFVVPLIDAPSSVDPLSVPGLMLILQQLVIGIIIGTIIQIVFNAITIAGENIAMTMGLGFAHMTDPVNGITIPVVSQLLTVIASLYFLALNGHIALISMLISSFELLPMNNLLASESLIAVAEWGGRMFIGAILISIPAVTALLIVNISMGLMTRVAPQMNIFSVGFPLSMMLGFIFIMVSIPIAMNVFQGLLNDSFQFLASLYRLG